MTLTTIDISCASIDPWQVAVMQITWQVAAPANISSKYLLTYISSAFPLASEGSSISGGWRLRLISPRVQLLTFSDDEISLTPVLVELCYDS